MVVSYRYTAGNCGRPKCFLPKKLFGDQCVWVDLDDFDRGQKTTLSGKSGRAVSPVNRDDIRFDYSD